MKNMMRLLAMVLALCMVLCLCACGGDDVGEKETTEATTPSTEATTPSTEADDGKVTYTVTVTDEQGKPIAGAMVQMCKDACVPAATDAEGKAVYKLPADTYKVSFLTLPAGYTYTTDATEFYFSDGETTLTIVLKAQN